MNIIVEQYIGIKINQMILKYNIDIFDSSTRKQSSEFIADLIGFPEYTNILFNPGGNFN